MAKKKSTKKSAKKASTKKTGQSKAPVVHLSEMEVGNNVFQMVGDTSGLENMNPMMMEKIMQGISKKLESLNLSEEEMEQIDLAELLNSMSVPKAETPQEKARELIYTAYETSDPKKMVAIARKALKLDPDNVDALVILAEHTTTNVFEAIDGYRRAIAAGERSLGEEFFKANEGHFWAIHETRPYMRALEELAGILRSVSYECGGSENLDNEVVTIYQKMLRLNPGDNQGIRYRLFYRLLEVGRDEDAEKLYKDYSDDGSAWWMYGRVLLDFRKSGDTAKSRKSLKEAVKYNKHFPLFLLGRKRFPATPPGHYGIGDANEAAYYMNDSFEIWQKTPDIMEWLAGFLDKK